MTAAIKLVIVIVIIFPCSILSSVFVADSIELISKIVVSKLSSVVGQFSADDVDEIKLLSVLVLINLRKPHCFSFHVPNLLERNKYEREFRVNLREIYKK